MPWSMFKPSDSKSAIASRLGSLNWICAVSSGPADATLGAASIAAVTATAPIHGLMDHSPLSMDPNELSLSET